MPKPSPRNRLIRISADEIPEPTAGDLERLEAAMRIPARARDVEEGKDIGPLVRRKASGELPRRPLGPVRRAILESLERRDMTRYQLWKKAHAHCKTLSASAVYDYLRGVRDIGVEYAEALMEAANLRVVGRQKSMGPKRATVGHPKRSARS